VSTNDSSHHLGDLTDLPDGEVRRFDVDDNGVVVCRVNGALFALEDNCSHADTPLSDGLLRGHQLICPLHGASFDVRDGQHSGPPAYTGVRCYKVIESPNGISVTRAHDPDKGDGFGGVGGMFRTR
jgi:3-phenylpropionate/trans-cinnamate dioxygenase ferredoxin component